MLYERDEWREVTDKGVGSTMLAPLFARMTVAEHQIRTLIWWAKSGGPGYEKGAELDIEEMIDKIRDTARELMKAKLCECRDDKEREKTIDNVMSTCLDMVERANHE